MRYPAICVIPKVGKRPHKSAPLSTGILKAKSPPHIRMKNENKETQGREQGENLKRKRKGPAGSKKV